MIDAQANGGNQKVECTYRKYTKPRRRCKKDRRFKSGSKSRGGNCSGKRQASRRATRETMRSSKKKDKRLKGGGLGTTLGETEDVAILKGTVVRRAKRSGGVNTKKNKPRGGGDRTREGGAESWAYKGYGSPQHRGGSILQISHVQRARAKKACAESQNPGESYAKETQGGNLEREARYLGSGRREENIDGQQCQG